MAAIAFYILVNIKTSNGFQTFGKFFLGSDRRLADNIFRKLKGTKKISKDTILNLELIETKNELPQNIQMISCTLEELAENCKIITRETFKFYNLAET
ncbi:MAG: hypothetical protein ACHQF0_11355 [Chitinophagales bacterium]